ncbi:molybdopterin molybdotransferase MoeA [Agromyces sp. SYSU T0242]|uniref:molybdopterin molybdotransferase MoeA n=1 Tax=Agromyces litoreus TaxID=3158561 RepID=UPI003391EA5A
MNGPVDWREARRRSVDAAPAPEVEQVRLGRALGRVLAEPLVTPIPLPHYASSAMDGWAVRGPAPWRVVPSVAATPGAVEPLGPGQARPIVTGGAVPAGADAVLRAEAALVEDGRLSPVGDVGRGDVAERRHIRPAGSEAAAGEHLLEPDTRLTPPCIALAAATGADALPVVRRPRVAIALTGDEVVESGVPGVGRVRDSFRVALPAALEALGAEVVAVDRIADDTDATCAAMLAHAADLVVTTGGTGRSEADHVRDALDRLDADLLVPSMAIRPGGPTLLARAGDRLVLGLPGNPLAAALGLVALGGPLLATWSRVRPPHPVVRSGAPLAGHEGVTGLVPATVRGDLAMPTPHAGAAMLRGLARADTVLVIPPGGVRRDEPVEALPLPWA